MDYSDIIHGFLDIFRKSYKILLKTNGKQISSLTLIFLLLSSILVLSNILIAKPYFVDSVLKLSISALSQTDPGFGSQVIVNHNIVAFVGIQWPFAVAGATLSSLFAGAATSFFFTTAAIISSSAAHDGVALSLKALLSRLKKMWKRPLVTLFYVTLMDLGYIAFVSISVASLSELCYVGLNPRWLFKPAAFASVALLYFYMSVVWSVAVIVSVLEEREGMVALGRAGEVAKGMKVKGLLLKLLFGALYNLVLHLQTIYRMQSTEIRLCVALVVVICLCSVKTMSLIAFTGFYYDCKKFHGEGHGEILDGTRRK